MALAVQNDELIAKGGSLGTGAECCCGPPPPPPPPPCIGACCVNGVCIEDTQEVCADLEGTWFGCDTECTESLCTSKEDCVDDCCPEVPDEISVTVTIDPVEVCYSAGKQPFSTFFARAVLEEFSVSETITLPLITTDPCPSYSFSGTIGRTTIEIDITLTLNTDGICVWIIRELVVRQCSEADTEEDFQSSCGATDKYGVTIFIQERFDYLGVSGCVGGTIISSPFFVGFDSDFCNAAANRSCEGIALNDCEPAETTATVTITV